MQMQMANFTMHWHQVFGLRQVQHQAHFFLAGMPGNMHRFNRVINDIGAALDEAVDGAINHFFVAWNRMR